MQKHGLRVIGLMMMTAIGLMAFTASAQAALELELYHLTILLGGIRLEKGKTETFTGKQVGTGVLKIPAKNSEIRCEAGKILKGTAEVGEDPGVEGGTKSSSGLSTTGKGEIEFEKCKVFEESSGKELGPCTKAFNEHNNLGKPIATFDFLFLLHRHTSPELNLHLLIWRFSSLEGIPFSKLEFGGTCSLPAKVEVTGSVAGETAGESETDGVTKEVEFDSGLAAPSMAASDQEVAKTALKFGANPAFIKAKATAELTGAGAGKAWGLMG
jgi:hypothetical protein